MYTEDTNDRRYSTTFLYCISLLIQNWLPSLRLRPSNVNWAKENRSFPQTGAWRGAYLSFKSPLASTASHSPQQKPVSAINWFILLPRDYPAGNEAFDAFVLATCNRCFISTYTFCTPQASLTHCFLFLLPTRSILLFSCNIVGCYFYIHTLMQATSTMLTPPVT